ncbi:MAG: VanW family protein [Eubacteriales bacterium]|nr:VanW family protein [Eubacteriales bacterium]
MKGNKKDKNRQLFLIISACVLVAALAVTAVLFLGNQSNVERVMDFGTVLDGVSVNGIDISGMTEEEARNATADVPQDLLKEVKLSLDVDGELHAYTADDFSIDTDYQDIMAQAVAYGHIGPFIERKQAADTAGSEGMVFTVSLTVDEAKLQTALAALKQTLDKEPQDATAVFTPWGHFEDGTPYAPDKQELIETAANGQELTYPEGLVRLTPEEMPIALRYQFWQNDHYEDDYKPAAATISRFLYIPEQTGLIADMASIAGEINEQVQSGAFSTITVPVQVTAPAVGLDDIKNQTQLITSWTSSYSTHNNKARNWNVAKLSGIICGVSIDPGVTWSINEEAGPRYVSNGWKLASGIVDGGYVDQPGGGVCQISSTVYNAAIRAAIETQSKHHSIVSGYMPKGLDATISTGGPDLKLTNPYTVPIYIVSYMNPEDKSITVEIYGPPVIDPATGEEVIYDFTSGNPSYYGSPVMLYIYDKTALPDGTPIPLGEDRVYAEMRQGMKVKTYRLFYKLDGTKYNEVDFENTDVKPINGKTYCNYPDPATVTPTPEPTEDPSAGPTEDPSAGPIEDPPADPTTEPLDEV